MTETTRKDKAQAEKETASDMVTLTIDGCEVTVPKGTTILKAARSAGIHIPTFCWHPKLKSVGACRICYVEVEKFPKLMVSCATEVMCGMVVHTDSDKVRQGRKAVLEFILANHPLDCPTCDKAGECDLQDLTFKHGVDDSRFDFRKNRFTDETVATTFDDVRIGPEIILNRNRCILCYKCVRANKGAFGEYDLGVYQRGNVAEINSAPGEQVDNPFSGNLVEICPVGALTNSDWRYQIRVWLTKTTPSLCNYTSSGVNVLFYKEDHKNRIYRVTSRPNDAIDDGWLSDITRYGYQTINSPDRLQQPLVKREGKQIEATWDEALDVIHKRFSEIKSKKGGVCIGGLAAPNLDTVTLHSISKFFRTVLKSNNLDFRCDYRFLPEKADGVFSVLCTRPFEIAGIDDSDVIVVFGSDLIREHPNEYLRIRKARNFGHPRIYTITPYSTKAADVADLELVYNVGTDEIVVNALCQAAIELGVTDHSQAESLGEMLTPASLAESAARCGLSTDDIKMVARAVAGGKKVTVIVGELATRSKARETIAASLANLTRLLGIEKRGQLAVLARYANSRGADMLGLIPDPSAQCKAQMEKLWGRFPECEARTTDRMLVLMKKEEISGFFVLGANPMMLYPDQEFAREGLERVEFLVACDLFETETTALADVVLPLSGWAEYAGDYVNLEGRVQRAHRAVTPIGQSRPGYQIVADIARRFDRVLFESDTAAQEEIDSLLTLKEDRGWPDTWLEVKGVAEEADDTYAIPLFIGDDAHHSGHLTEKAASLAEFAGEAYIELSPELASRYRINKGDPVRVETEVGKIIVPARVSEHLDNDVVFIPRNFSSMPVTALLMRKRRVDRVRISKVDE